MPLGMTVKPRGVQPADVPAESRARRARRRPSPAASREVRRSSVRCQRLCRSATRSPPTTHGPPAQGAASRAARFAWKRKLCTSSGRNRLRRPREPRDRPQGSAAAHIQAFARDARTADDLGQPAGPSQAEDPDPPSRWLQPGRQAVRARSAPADVQVGDHQRQPDRPVRPGAEAGGVVGQALTQARLHGIGFFCG